MIRHRDQRSRLAAQSASMRPTLTRLYWWAFIVRACAGLLAYGLTLYADMPIVEDARYYEDAGFEISREWLAGRSVDIGVFGQGAQTASLLVMGIAAFYYALGGIRALPLLLVLYSAVTALVPRYVYLCARELQTPEMAARRAGWLVALSPAFVFWSGALYKEGLTLLLLSIAAYHTLRLQRRWSGWSLAVIVVCTVILWGVRYYLAILLAIAVALSLLWERRPHAPGLWGRRILSRQVLIVAAFVVLIGSVGIWERGERVLVERDEGVLVDLDVRRHWSAREARSGYLEEASIATPHDALRYFPLGLFYFLTAPLPWQTGAMRQNLIIPENAFWLMLYPLIVVGIGRSLRRNAAGTSFVLLLTGGMCVIYALLVGNIGTAYRMRSQVWLLWAPFATWGWEVVRERPRQTREARVVANQRRFLAGRAR